MRVDGLSHLTLWNTPRSAVSRLQTDISRLNREMVTGRMADVGLNLGAEAARATELHIDLAGFDSAVTSNNTAMARLRQTDSAMARFSADAETFLAQLLTAKSTHSPLGGLADNALNGFMAAANVSDGRNFLFAGINTAVQPLNDFDGAPKAAIDAAFLARFGITQDDPAIGLISAADMADFIDTEFAALFDDPDWGTNWSTASDQLIRSRISPSETVETSVSANEQATRKLAMVYSMVAGLGTDALGSEARQALIDKAISVIGAAMSDLTDRRSDLGAKQNRVSEATERLLIQKSLLQERVAQIEGVDPAETKVKIDLLSTQIEMSYALTARIMRLSILNYT